MRTLFLLIGILTCTISHAQTNNMGIGTTSPDASAKLDISSQTQGLLCPRMSSLERNAILNPATGLLVFDTTDSTFWFFSGLSWRSIETEIPTFPSDLVLSNLIQTGLAGNVETILGSFVVPANTLENDGEWLDLHAFGDFSSDSSTITFRIAGQNLVFPSTVQGSWEVNIRIYRESNLAMKISGTLNMPGYTYTARLNGLANFNGLTTVQVLASQEPALVNGVSMEGLSIRRTN